MKYDASSRVGMVCGSGGDDTYLLAVVLQVSNIDVRTSMGALLVIVCVSGHSETASVT